MIYLDNAATSFIKPQIVKDAVNFALTNYTANAGRSGHKPAMQTAEMVYETREELLKFFNANNHQLIFTKNCTEALNLAIFGLLKPGENVITSCYEHNSVLRPLHKLKTQGVDVSVLSCDLKDFDIEITKHIKPNTKAVIVTATSNVTGECPNLKEISNICVKNNIILIVDGAQSSGHSVMDLDKLGVDIYAFAGHKGLGSITGVGGLIVKNDVKLKPLIYGGTGTESENLSQPNDLPEGYEAGTLPIIPIISLCAGIKHLQTNLTSILATEKKLSEFLFNELKKLDFVKLYSPKDAQNVFSFNIIGMDSSTVANLLDEEFDICVRAGLHCAPLVHKKLGTLKEGAVRVSIDYNNTFQQINYLVFALKQINVKYN